MAPPTTDAFSEAAPAGTAATASADPQMLGDSLSYVIGRGVGRGSSPPSSFNSGHLGTALDGSGFKIADDESPMPQDRVFTSLGYYSGALHSLNGVGASSESFTREVFGFEKTFLDGNASIEIRAPIFQNHGDGASSDDFGDLTIVGKYALINEHGCGRDTVLCGGVAVTVPTGPSALTGVGSVDPTVIQPYVGALVGNEALYVHGFSSLAISTTSSVATAWFTDLGVGYFAYKSCDGFLRGIVPTLESHLSVALGKEGTDAAGLGLIDTLDLTGGLHLMLAGHSNMTLGYAIPVTGPQPFRAEYLLQFNVGF